MNEWRTYEARTWPPEMYAGREEVGLLVDLLVEEEGDFVSGADVGGTGGLSVIVAMKWEEGR